MEKTVSSLCSCLPGHGYGQRRASHHQHLFCHACGYCRRQNQPATDGAPLQDRGRSERAPRIHKGNPQLAARIPPDIQAERLLVVCQSSSIVGYLRTDPAATSLCPLTLSLVQINGKTTAYYLQRGALLTDNTAARAVGQKTDESVLDALHAAQKQ